MPGKHLSVVVTRRLPEVVETRLKELFDVELRADDTPMTAEELADAMGRADVLVSTITDKIDAKMLGRAGEKLKLIKKIVAPGPVKILRLRAGSPTGRIPLFLTIAITLILLRSF